jgi:hypothetical protein
MREATGPAQIRRLMLDNILRRLQRARSRARHEGDHQELHTEDVTWWDPAGTTQGREAMNEQGQKLLD